MISWLSHKKKNPILLLCENLGEQKSHGLVLP